MTLFAALAALLVAAALAFLLPPLLRARKAGAAASRAEANASIYREQLEELAAELQRGAITREQYEKSCLEVEHRVVSEHEQTGQTREKTVSLRATAIAIALLLPLVTALGYWQLGSPQALSVVGAKGKGEHEVTGAQIEALVEQLAVRMRQTPEDAEGWMLLGRSLGMLGRHERSAQAYAKAAQLQPRDAGVLADYADALAMAQGRKLAGEPFALVKRALEIDPENLKALALAGSAEFEAKDYGAAIGYWERVMKLAPADSEFGRSVLESIAEARAVGGSAPAPAKQQARKSGSPLKGTVSLDPALKAQVSPGDTVFVLARPASGSRMPLAIARATVAALPYDFTLDDSMAMSPDAKLSRYDKVVVVARISKSGKATPEKGDIEGVSAPVAPGSSSVRIVLQRIVQ